MTSPIYWHGVDLDGFVWHTRDGAEGAYQRLVRHVESRDEAILARLRRYANVLDPDRWHEPWLCQQPQGRPVDLELDLAPGLFVPTPLSA